MASGRGGSEAPVAPRSSTVATSSQAHGSLNDVILGDDIDDINDDFQPAWYSDNNGDSSNGDRNSDRSGRASSNSDGGSDGGNSNSRALEDLVTPIPSH